MSAHPLFLLSAGRTLWVFWGVGGLRVFPVWEGCRRRLLRGDPHLVPLSRQAVRLLATLKPYTETAGLVFPGERQRSRPISDNTLRTALISLGYGPEVQTVHGFRASARTILDEVLEFDPLLIEAQLAHVIRDTNGRAYNRTSHIKRRAQMMQAWADYLDQLAAGGASIIPIRKAA